MTQAPEEQPLSECWHCLQHMRSLSLSLCLFFWFKVPHAGAVWKQHDMEAQDMSCRVHAGHGRRSSDVKFISMWLTQA